MRSSSCRLSRLCVCLQEANDDLDTELLDVSVEESFKVSFTPCGPFSRCEQGFLKLAAHNASKRKLGHRETSQSEAQKKSTQPTRGLLLFFLPDAVRLSNHGQPAGLLPRFCASIRVGRGDGGDPRTEAPRRVHTADLQHPQG